MRVLLTHERFAPDFAGGGEYVALETARHLMKRGVEVTVLTTGDPSIDRYEGIPTLRLPVSRYMFNLKVGHIMGLAREADLIHTFNYNAALPSFLAGKRLNKPVVCLVTGLFGAVWKEMRGPFVGRAFMAWERFLLKRGFSRIIFASDYSMEMGTGLGSDASRSVVNTPGIALEEYAPAKEKEDVVLFVGKLDVRKGIYEFLAVAKALPHARFMVMGWGPAQDAVRAKASDNVEFVPFESGRRLRETFSKARIFLFLSKAETFGIAIAEAMASGCAVVSTVPLKFEGVYLKPGDTDGAVDAVRRLWEDRGETRRMGARNVELAKSYSWERYTDRLLQIYSDVLGERDRPVKPKRRG